MSDHEQGTPEWFEARAGHVTASKIGAVMAKPRKGQKESVMRKEYMAQIICERLTKKSLEEERGNFFDIRRGNDLESAARVEYEMRNRVVVDTAGFIEHPSLDWAGCSPDGLVGKLGLVQIKAPRRHVHLDWIMRGVVPSEHRDQMLFELACHPQREWSDFVSYVDDLEDIPHLQLFQVRLPRDTARIMEIEAAVAKFNAEVEQIIAKLPTAEGRTSLQEQLEQSLEAVNAGEVVPEG
jgi:hypothetical protein